MVFFTMYVAKELKLPNASKARQIEDFWEYLKSKIYEKTFKNFNQRFTPKFISMNKFTWNTL
ncbi:hypothetical protein BpHYR1_051910 [Brachionus plicatilis]|uniref:Uncharacterized protein n=1 Tax=Brachionus plicatilis TaxID=10195 RepID=A0A3M7RLV7_BRAPC|nr:hypothetical protein BpHYR1_051910 [Brachionus plicatilis]